MSGERGFSHFVAQSVSTVRHQNLYKSSPGTPWCESILLMDVCGEDSGGNLEVDFIYYFGACVLAGRWHGQLVLLPVDEGWARTLEQAVCWREGSLPSGHWDWRDDGNNSLYFSNGQEDVPSPHCDGGTKIPVLHMNGSLSCAEPPLVSYM